jgi:hypothetical protein
METVSQIFALAIFVVMFIVITTGKVPRYIAALAGGTRVLYLRKASLFDHNCPCWVLKVIL